MIAQEASKTEEMLQVKPRYYAFDYIRSAALFMVVTFHVVIGMHDSHIGMPKSIYILNEALRTLRMPMFFFASGMLFHIAFEKRTGTFWKSLFVGLAIPYLVWSPIQWAGKALLSSFTTNHVDMQDLLFILWKPIDHFWFLYCLIILRVLLRLDRQNGRLLIVLFFSSIAYMFLFRLNWLTPFWKTTLISGTARGMVYFSAGVWLARNHEVTLFKFSKKNTFIISVSGGCLFAIFRYLEWSLISKNYAIIASALDILIEPFVGIMTALVIANSLKPPTKLLGKICMLMAEGSLVIYILHPMIAAMTRGILLKLGLGYWYIILTLGIITSIAIPLGIFVVARNRMLLPALALGQNRIPRSKKLPNVKNLPVTT